MSVVLGEFMTTSNPANGNAIGRVAVTPTGEVASLVDRAREAQWEWGRLPWIERRKVLERWWKVLTKDLDAWTELIRDEIGKPRTEALAGDVVPTLDAIRWTVKNAGRGLADERIARAWQRWLLMPKGRLRWSPVGVVGMIGTWNYPLFLNAPPIAQALAAGNAVVWKPSELALRTGQKIQESLAEAGVPPGLVTAVYGGGDVGRALVESRIDKGMFTGGIENGRRVLSALAARGIPAVAELSGFDPAIILPGSLSRSTVRALTWASFVGCGQTCVAVKRTYVVGDPKPWAEAFAASASALKVGDPKLPGIDIGPMITRGARERFDAMIRAAVERGAKVLAGGRALEGPGWFYAPTVLLAETAEPEEALAGAFGPVVMIRGVPDVATAVGAANAGEYGLGASVWGGPRRTAQAVARELQAGSVSINEAVTPTAHAVAPFGGCKGSGFGRAHGLLGLREFTQPQAVFERRPGGYRPQLFPYANAALVAKFMSYYCRCFHPRA